jgi:hypothetical protein
MAMNNPTAVANQTLVSGMMNMSTLTGNATAIADPAAFRAGLNTAAIRNGNLSPLAASLTGQTGAAAVTNGMRRVAMVEGTRGTYSKKFMQNILTSGGGAEMRTMGAVGRTVGFGVENIAMNETAEKLIRPLASALDNSPALMNRAMGRGVTAGSHLASSLAPEIVSARTGLMATEIVDKGIIKSLGTRGAMQAARAGGARVGLAVAGEAALAAIPGVNLIFAADMAFQLAKLAGLGVKAGINLAKDGLKSMQGTMNNDVFGNGYKDNEVAATSRARGVMAIQNSRMNARSLLGSEGAMMAAHFG